MSKIDLKKIEYVGIWLWRMLLTSLLLIVINNQDISINENRVNYSYLEPLITNTAKIVSENNSEPEIPSDNSENYEASCPAEVSILDDPGKVIAFFDAIEVLDIPNSPYKQQILVALLIGDKEDVFDYLEDSISAGYPKY